MVKKHFKTMWTALSVEELIFLKNFVVSSGGGNQCKHGEGDEGRGWILAVYCLHQIPQVREN
jgi:hypothetical protein